MIRLLLVMALCASTQAAAVCLPASPDCVPEDPLRASFIAVIQPPCHDAVHPSSPARPDDPMEPWAKEHAALAHAFLVRVVDACGEDAASGRALQALAWIGSEEARSELGRRLANARGPFRSDVLRAVLELDGEHSDARLAEHVSASQDPAELWLLVSSALEFGGPATAEALLSRAAGETDEGLPEVLRATAKVDMRPTECHLDGAEQPGGLGGHVCHYVCRGAPTFRRRWQFTPFCAASAPLQGLAANDLDLAPSWLRKVAPWGPLIGAGLLAACGMASLISGAVIGGSRATNRFRSGRPGGWRLLSIAVLLGGVGIAIMAMMWHPLMNSLSSL